VKEVGAKVEERMVDSTPTPNLTYLDWPAPQIVPLV